MRMWKPKSLLQEQHTFLTTAPSLQTPQVAFLTNLQMLLMQQLGWNNSVGGKNKDTAYRRTISLTTAALWVKASLFW